MACINLIKIVINDFTAFLLMQNMQVMWASVKDVLIIIGLDKQKK